MTAAEVAPPALPPGRAVELPGRGTTFVREAGDPTAPAVVLLHGWCVNADLNWWPVFGALAEHHRVIALDHRGHSRGIRDGRRFTLEDCAGDVAALVEALRLGPSTIVGYSMGGAVAQLVWRRHPGLVGALVLCATSRSFSGRPKERGLESLIDALAPTVRVMPPAVRAEVAIRLLSGRRNDQDSWAWAAASLRAHDWLRIMEAGRATLRFDSRAWAGEIDVPTAIVTTTGDTVVPLDRQLELAAAITGATTHELLGGHTACATTPDAFSEVLAAACLAVGRGAVLPRPPEGVRKDLRRTGRTGRRQAPVPPSATSTAAAASTTASP